MAELWALRVVARLSGVILRRRFWFVLGGEREEGILGETYDAVEGMEHIESVFLFFVRKGYVGEGFRGRNGGR